MLSSTKAANVMKRMQAAMDSVLGWQPRYQLGHEDPRAGLDCSGFVMSVLGKGGFPGKTRLTATQLMTQVYKLRSRPEDQGGYADFFSAYGWKTEDGYDHIVIPYTNALVIEVNIRDHLRDLAPRTLRATEITALTSGGWAEHRGYGYQNDWRIWDLANVFQSVYLHASAFGLDTLDFMDVIPMTTIGASVDKTPANLTQLVKGAVTYDALVYVLAILYGRNPMVLRAEMDYAKSSRLNDSVWELGTSIYDLNRLTWKILKLVKSIIGVEFYYFMDIWKTMSESMDQAGGLSPLASGIAVYERKYVEDAVTAGLVTQGWIPTTILDTFLESEGSPIMMYSSGDVPTLPVRIVR